MMKIWTILITTTIITIISAASVSAQRIQPLNYNHALLNEIESTDGVRLKAASGSIVFDSVFFEDFSSYHFTHLPKTDVWADRSVFINSTWANAMPSVGVATLDALNAEGYPYYKTLNTVIASDVLTSKYFDFVNDTVPLPTTYFSFYFQPGGKGDLPEGIDTVGGRSGEGRDTLLLDFCHPDSRRWENIWWTLDNTKPDTFTHVIQEIPQEFLKDSFQFRFRNYTSAGKNNVQGQDLGGVVNNDVWHIDYIEMKTTEDTDELGFQKDITFTKPLLPTLKYYTAVPYNHLLYAQVIEERTTVPLQIYIMDFDTTGADKEDFISLNRRYQTFDLTTGDRLKSPVNVSNVFPDKVYNFDEFFTAVFPSYEDREIGRFELRTFFEVADIEQPATNDTVRRHETYYDHYAYDDGSAEYSFGLLGETQDLNGIAYRFRNYYRGSEPDSLHALLIYFTKAIDSASYDAAYEFTIRPSDNGVPSDEVLYSSGDQLLFPDYDRTLNKFTRIDIEPAIAVPDTFFVVIRQLNGFVGIGYDINRNATNNIFTYTITGESFGWQPYNSGISGALMIRPSFKTDDLITVGTKDLPQEKNKAEILLYPNPAKDFLRIRIENADYSANYETSIFNSMGQMVGSYPHTQTEIDIQNLPGGIYFLRVIETGTSNINSIKFIKE